jgi:hypothetical protein|tara:strand:+ start:2844 stop:3047 length:204 start_codon:yes stop_codon:yes gene_type:complete
MEGILFVVEYKVANELFAKKFVYETKCLDSTDGLIYTNTMTAQELIINKNFLEYRIERIMRQNEKIE